MSSLTGNNHPSSISFLNHTRPLSSPHISTNFTTTSSPIHTPHTNDEHINPLDAAHTHTQHTQHLNQHHTHVHHQSVPSPSSSTTPTPLNVTSSASVTASSPLVTTNTNTQAVNPFAAAAAVSTPIPQHHHQPNPATPTYPTYTDTPLGPAYNNNNSTALSVSAPSAYPSAVVTSPTSSPYRPSGWPPTDNNAQWTSPVGTYDTLSPPATLIASPQSTRSATMQHRQQEPILKFGEQPAVKPNLSYAALIGEALLLSPPPHHLYVAEISESIKNRYAYFRQNPSKIYNGVRHQTSMCEAFVKLNRPYGDQSGGARKWAIREGCQDWFRGGGYHPAPKSKTPKGGSGIVNPRKTSKSKETAIGRGSGKYSAPSSPTFQGPDTGPSAGEPWDCTKSPHPYTIDPPPGMRQLAAATATYDLSTPVQHPVSLGMQHYGSNPHQYSPPAQQHYGMHQHAQHAGHQYGGYMVPNYAASPSTWTGSGGTTSGGSGGGYQHGVQHTHYDVDTTVQWRQQVPVGMMPSSSPVFTRGTTHSTDEHGQSSPEQHGYRLPQPQSSGNYGFEAASSPLSNDSRHDEA